MMDVIVARICQGAALGHVQRHPPPSVQEVMSRKGATNWAIRRRRCSGSSP